MLKDMLVPVLPQSKGKDPNQQFINCTYLKTSVFLEAYETLLLGLTWFGGRKVLCCWTLESDCLACLESRGVHFGAHLANDAAARKLTRGKGNLP